MTPVTFKHLYEFILANKKDKVFKGYDDMQIVTMLIEGLHDECLYYAADSNNQITGMILAKISVPSKTLWVEENLAMTLDNLKAFAKKAKQQFPEYTFQGFKCGKNRNYDKLLNKLIT